MAIAPDAGRSVHQDQDGSQDEIIQFHVTGGSSGVTFGIIGGIFAVCVWSYCRVGPFAYL